MTQFTDKKVLVLGGSRGIGAAIVRRLAGAGANVTFTYAGSKDAAEQLAADTGSTAVRADSALREDTVRAVRDAGPLDILVVNAGVAVFGNPLETDPDAIDRMIDINVRSPYHAMVEAGRTMNDNGRMIVIGSVNGDRMPVSGGAGYGLTKAAVQGMARGFARDFGPRGITVNVVQPGPVDTDMNPADGPMAELLKPTMAIRRYATVDEIAAMVAYLASDEAAMVTGAMHTIDGGLGI